MEIPTNMQLLIFLAACVLFTTTECETSFTDCPGGSVDVEKGTTGTLTCKDYSVAQITWEFKSRESAFSTIGRCTDSSTCTLEPTYVDIFTLTSKSGTSSHLGLTTTFTRSLKTATFSCDGVECVVKIVEKIEPSLPVWAIVLIVIGCLCGVGLIIGLGFLIRKKCCSKEINQPPTKESECSPEGISLTSQPHA